MAWAYNVKPRVRLNATCKGGATSTLTAIAAADTPQSFLSDIPHRCVAPKQDSTCALIGISKIFGTVATEHEILRRSRPPDIGKYYIIPFPLLPDLHLALQVSQADSYPYTSRVVGISKVSRDRK